MSEKIKVSTVIVNWNTRDRLVVCISSLVGTWHEVESEIIVVDNASTDGSAEAVEAQFPQVKVIRSPENVGFARGNNLGIAATRGDYLCLVNSDIEIRDDSLQRMVAFFESHPDIGLLAPRLRNPDASIQQSCWSFPDLARSLAHAVGLHRLIPGNPHFSRIIDLSVENPIQVDVACGAFWVIRRSALDRVGLLDERFYFYGEDIDWCRRFWNAGWRVVYFPNTDIVHFGGASSASAPVRFYVQMTQARMQYWRKHYAKSLIPLFYSTIVSHHMIRLVGSMIAASVSRTHSDRYIHKAMLSWHALKWLLTGVMPA